MIATKDITKKETISSISDEKTNKDIINPEENMKEKPSESENKMEEISNGNNGRWGKSEHLRFLAGCLLYKNNWKKVETYVRTRTSTQIRSHAQKYLKKLEKKYFSKESGNKSANDDNEDFFDYNFIPKENNDKNNLEKNIVEKNNNNDIGNELKDKKDNENLEDIKTSSMKLKEITDDDNKFKLTDEKIKQLVDNLNKENFDIEIVEKIIINIFRPNKKCEDIAKPEPKKSSQKFNSTHFKTSKNIFLCQKQKREINYESKIKDALNSNNQIDLQNLIKIYKQKCSPEYYILLELIENN